MKIGHTRWTGIVLIALMMLPPVSASANSDRPSLNGRWGLLRTTRILDDVPVLGEVATRMQTLSILTVRQAGRTVTAREKVCRIRMKSNTDLVSIAVKRGLAKGLSGTKRKMRLVGEGDQLRIEQERQLFVWGATLAKPVEDLLPTTSDDPRLKDVDKDDKPGMSILIKGIIHGEMYVVQRDWSQWSGRLVTDDRIEGVVDWSFERNIVGRSNPLLPTKHKARVDSRPGKNSIILVRLPRKMKCKQLKKSVKRYFGKTDQSAETTLAPEKPSK